jgi:hypothetical protein
MIGTMGLLFRLSFLAGPLLVIAISCAPASTPQKGFLPLAKVEITLAHDNGASVVGALREFAHRERLRDDIGKLSRSGRGVYQIRIWLSDKSFFYGDNFVDAKKFSLRAYSHEDEGAWRPVWERLLKSLEPEFRSSGDT